MGILVHFLPSPMLGAGAAPQDTHGLPWGSSIPKRRPSKGPFWKDETQL